MKKIVATFGLISGAISSVMMLGMMRFVENLGFDKAEILGYTTIVLSFLLVFFGIRSYRDNPGGGVVSFGRAFTVGLLITIVSCMCYVATWEVLYFNFAHGFMDKYSAHMVEQIKASGASPEKIQAQLRQMKSYRELYQNPLFNAGVTFLEPFPIGLVMTLVSAAILRKKSVPAANQS
jgi:hypothetical protein